MFFDNVVPFFKNSYSNEIDCSGFDISTSLKCKAFITNNSDSKNYLTLSRLEVSVNDYTS